ncbi:unnamed protein product [Rotaria sordida]|uniref:Enoyl reductase (ER) domain-containing protein n=1 Tax=Rotaria sordida TaxID=392033 RepID=A0A813ZZY6_9BILA|nr:unnamed protein product [Rotaria sordida]CAF3596778.1 unnamed protein product [Rotaria sordida]
MTESISTNYSIPSVMKAAQQNGYGEVRNVLTLRNDVPVPYELSSKQILIRVHAGSINQIDWKVLNGNFSSLVRLSFPHVPGKDVAGVIVSIGLGVKRFQIGDKVYGNLGMNDGSFAEYVRGDESLFSLKPNNITMEEAAAIPLACQTSYQVLFKKASPPIGMESKILICGGSTATGLYAIQLAKAVGAHVTATCSQRNFSLMEKLGQNYDVVYDCIGGEQQWISAQQVLKCGGQFITIVGDDRKSIISLKSLVSVGSSLINRKFWSIFGSSHHNYIFHFVNQNFQELDDIRTKYIETGKVKPLIDTIYDWQKDDVEALYLLYEKSKSEKAQGKLILKIAHEE